MSSDGGAEHLAGQAYGNAQGVLRTAQVAACQTDPVAHLAEALGPGPFTMVALFVSPAAAFEAVVAEAERLFPDTDTVACTTAGEIGGAGYEEGQIVAIGFPETGFATTSLMIEGIDALAPQPVMDRIALERMSLQDRELGMEDSFAFLVVDGLSLSEDTLAATIAPALREMPVFGGSAGDGTAFNRTLVALNGLVASNAAVLTLARSRYRTEVFSLDHLVPTDQQMVVTDADPARRIVKEINAEPAAREYARIVGKDPEQLDRFTFASHPVAVRIGSTHHVRAIQQVTDQGDLVFFSAIDEGMVLSVATPQDMARHLRRKMAELSATQMPVNIIGCDCILRRIEAEQSQQSRELSEILAAHNVTGFSTYGEQIGPLHVNHTMSGVAFYAPADG